VLYPIAGVHYMRVAQLLGHGIHTVTLSTYGDWIEGGKTAPRPTYCHGHFDDITVAVRQLWFSRNAGSNWCPRVVADSGIASAIYRDASYRGVPNDRSI